MERKATHPGIHFAGLLPREAVWDRLASFDALVLPTLWHEASPLTIDESFAAGTPVIGSSIGALPTMIRDGVDGLLFPPGDVDTLAGILQALQTSPQRVSIFVRQFGR
ncbi:MAG: glycosyltransferase [Chloroflexota bacterium]